MAQTARKVIFKFGQEVNERTYFDKNDKVDKRKNGKRKSSDNKSNTSSKRSKISKEKLNKKVKNLEQNMSTVQSKIKQMEYKKPPLNVFILNRKSDESFYLPDNVYEQVNKSIKQRFQPIVKPIIDDEIIEISDDEENKNSSLLNRSQTELLKNESYIHDDKTKIKMTIKDVTLIPDQPKFLPIKSKERIKLEKEIKKFETQPCCSKDIIKYDKRLNELKIENCLSFVKVEKIPGLDISENLNQNLRINMKDINPNIKKLEHSKKTKTSFKKMIRTKGLFSFFKCMAAKCAYTTMSEDNFNEHLNLHVQYSYYSDYFLYCSYCTFVAKDSQTLIDHLKSYHMYCKFQCNKCFYRSVEARSVFDHQRIHHVDTSNTNQILECPRLSNEEYPYEKNYQRFKLRFKNKLICAVCQAEYYSIDLLLSHLETYNGGDFEIMAQNQSQMINQNLADNKIGKYQCYECERNHFGSNLLTEIRNHMQNHPKRFHFAAMCDAESKRIKISKIRSGAIPETIKFTDDIRTLYNDEEKTCIELE
ncbi:hypothetical protein PVAND_011101 [Polypedilum vanderplanki]|uniref:C2H2-type domain-containing protein n=1 Tax=Polypedilum vanderplanki TaxID=319348 RepID=A0A9J6CHK5_POLVA|nr:hypothetical protein PVAND_011101 [Polypedilum vanderplanki]